MLKIKSPASVALLSAFLAFNACRTQAEGDGRWSWDGAPAAQAPAAIDSPSPVLAGKPSRGKVLVILSSEDKITLKDSIVHPTGFFLSELMVPVRALVEAGYTPVFANPKGTPPVMDKISDTAFWFGDAPDASSEKKEAARRGYQEARELCMKLGVCGEGVTGTRAAKSFYHVLLEPMSQYKGVLVPGGHAPMEDLWKSLGLGAVLRHFHEAGKPTALICHGPIALLSTLSWPESYIFSVMKNDAGSAAEGAKNWIYKGYRMTVFSTPEEQQEEPGQDNALGGYVRFYPAQALEMAGGHVARADKWTSNIVVDRELITAQNPMSDSAFAAEFLKALARRK